MERSVAEPPPIHLQSRIVEQRAELPGLAGDPLTGRVHLIASFERTITRKEIDKLRERDVIVLDRCPVNAYVLSVPADYVRDGRLRQLLPEDSQLAPMVASDKLSPALRAGELHGVPKVPPYTARHEGRVEAIVLFFGDVSVDVQTRILVGNEVLRLQRLSAINGWRIALPEERILTLAQRDSVKWVEEGPPPPQDDNDEVRGPKGVNADAVQAVTGPNGHGLTGKGVVIAQWETNNASAAHMDLKPRVTIGDALIPPDARLHRYSDADGDGFYDVSDPLYLDVDDSLSVTPGDRRVPGYVVVQPGDADANPPTRLRELRHGAPPYESYANRADDPDERADFDPGEVVYMEQNNLARGTVSAGAVCTIEQMEEAPDPPTTPTCGDIRRTAVPRNDPNLPPYPAGSTVQAADDDVNRSLRIRSDAPHRHATHVAGTMIGAGALRADYKGVAPGAALISYHVKRLGNDSNAGIDDVALRDEHKSAAEAGATIVNNSWSVQDYYCALQTSDNGYRTQSALNDALASGYNSDGTATAIRRMLLVYSAGNRGSSGCWPWHSVPIPNSAKNALTVANVAPGAGPLEAALSNDSRRGPTGSPATPLGDGRLKPDLSAPGRELPIDRYSGVKSSVPPETLAPSGSYEELGGTSMAAPAVSGSAALLSEWFKRSCDVAGPTPDLLRAALVHTANDVKSFLTISSSGTQSVAQPPRTGPDYGSGYGAVDVAAAVAVMMHHRRAKLTDADAPIEYPLSVGQGVPQLKVTLAWDDPPYACFCDADPEHGLLQNDLDVVLIAPDGKKHAPWQLNPADPAALATPSGAISGDVSPFRDQRNTIEQIVVTDPISGEWKISISAAKLNSVFDAQPFALVSEFLTPASDDPALCPGGDGG